MKTTYFELYTDYLMVNAAGYATATGLSNIMKGEVSHDEITRLLSKQEFTSKTYLISKILQLGEAKLQDKV